MRARQVTKSPCLSGRQASHQATRKSKGSIIVFSGPSGSGKTTLAEKLLRRTPLKGRLVRGVSVTTRPKRSGEKEGRHYFFISAEELRRAFRAKKILEWTRYLGYYYATSRPFIEQHLKKGKDILLCLDFKGALTIKKLYPANSVTVFIMPPSVEELRKRIEGRCNKTKREEVDQRLKLAQQELCNACDYDYIVVNKTLRQAISELEGIILRARSTQSKE